MISMFRAVAFTAVSLMCVTFGYAADGGYVVLVPSAPAPPPLLPTVSVLKGSVAVGMRSVAIGGPIYNQSAVAGAVSKSFNEKFAQGFELAAQSGQKGVLVDVRVYQQSTNSGKFYSVRNGDVNAGVNVVGVGPSPAAVMLNRMRTGTIYEPVEPGKSLAPGISGYYFAKLVGKQYEVSRFDIDLLERWASMTVSTQAVMDAILQKESAAALNDYIEALTTRVRRTADAAVVSNLVASRNEAVKAIISIEAELEKQLRRAARIERTSQNLQFWSNVLSIGSAVSQAAVSMGETPQMADGTAPKNSAELKGAVDAAGADARTQVIKLRAGRQQAEAKQVGAERQLRSTGEKYNLDSRGIPLVKP